MIHCHPARAAAFAALALIASAAPAQFRLDRSASGQRAAAASANANAPIRPMNGARMNALSPLGGRPGVPATQQPFARAAPLASYVGAPPAPTAASLPNAAAPAPAAVLGDDPNKPRQVVQPQSLKFGVAPRL